MIPHLARSDGCNIWYDTIKRGWSNEVMLRTAHHWYRVLGRALRRWPYNTQVRGRLRYLCRCLDWPLLLHVCATRHHRDISTGSRLLPVIVIQITTCSFEASRGHRLVTSTGDVRRTVQRSTHFTRCYFRVHSWGGGFTLGLHCTLLEETCNVIRF